MTDEALAAATNELVDHVLLLGPDVRVARRLLATGTAASTSTITTEGA